jgi:hypothetical protein
MAKLLYYYPSSNISVQADGLAEFATAGNGMGLTALNVSQTATGQQQRANNIYAETTFICPSYWIAEAYNAHGRTGYKYQYSVPNAVHGSDSNAYFGMPMPNLGPDFILAFERIWGNFVVNSNPSISSAVANGARRSFNGSYSQEKASALEEWPVFGMWDRRMANLNQTGGTPTVMMTGGPTPGSMINVTILTGAGVVNDLGLVDAYEWEGGRGRRCDFWRSVAGLAPE